MPIPQEESEYWTQRASQHDAEMKQRERPSWPTLHEAYRSNKADLDAKRKAWEEQRKQDPYHWDGQSMPRPMSDAEKRAIINRTPHDDGQ